MSAFWSAIPCTQPRRIDIRRRSAYRKDKTHDLSDFALISCRHSNPLRQALNTRDEGMHLRQATLADAPVLAEIGYLAFNKEPIDGHWFPHKDRYVDDYRRAILSELTMRLVTPGEVIMVVEIDEDDCGEPKVASKARKIVAYSVFVKHGSKPEDLANWSPDTITKSTYILMSL